MAEKNTKKVDLTKIATNIITTIKKNPDLIDDFLKDPVKFVEKKTGLDLPDDQINKIIDKVKKEVASKIDAEKIAKGIKLVEGLLKNK